MMTVIMMIMTIITTTIVLIIIIRPYRNTVYYIVTDRIPWSDDLSLCQSVGLSVTDVSLQKRLNRSRCRLGS